MELSSLAEVNRELARIEYRGRFIMARFQKMRIKNAEYAYSMNAIILSAFAQIICSLGQEQTIVTMPKEKVVSMFRKRDGVAYVLIAQMATHLTM